MSPDELRQEVELKVVEYIKNKLTDGSMTEERSQQIAQHVLDQLKPGMSFDDLFKAIFTLDDAYMELAVITLPYIRDYEINVTQKVRHQVSDMIRTGQYQAAEELGKKAAAGEVKVVWQAVAKAPKPA